ncbi:hypothetical protein ASD54_07495 [Rhizobium sp. Root149]|nr:hypothetical protein ASD54_07495 [Rhizobium sp. Root149]
MDRPACSGSQIGGAFKDSRIVGALVIGDGICQKRAAFTQVVEQEVGDVDIGMIRILVEQEDEPIDVSAVHEPVDEVGQTVRDDEAAWAEDIVNICDEAKLPRHTDPFDGRLAMNRSMRRHLWKCIDVHVQSSHEDDGRPAREPQLKRAESIARPEFEGMNTKFKDDDVRRRPEPQDQSRSI